MMQAFFRIGGLLILLGLIPLAQAAERVALVIGNGNYANAPLRNPINDATDVATALKGLGFQVIRVVNADLRGMKRALRDFRDAAQGASLSLFFYAGHGAQFQGQNYLLPLGAEIRQAADLDIEALSAQRIQRQLETAGSRVNLIVLDACRDNPYISLSRGGSRGLARMDATGSGTLISYSTAPGKTAADGDGRNSPYTTALLRELAAHPDRSLLELFNDVSFAVQQQTDGQQIPWIQYSPLPPGIQLTNGGQRDNPPPSLTETHTPNQGELSVESQPPGAMIYVDGGRLGKAPQSLKNLPVGQITVEAKLEGYRDYREKVWIRAGERSALRLELKAEAEPTHLTIKTSPADARVRIMNIGPAYTDGIELTPGKFDIEVSAPGYRTRRNWHSLAAGEQVLTFDLEREPAQSPTSTPTPQPVPDPTKIGGMKTEFLSVDDMTPVSGSVRKSLIPLIADALRSDNSQIWRQRNESIRIYALDLNNDGLDEVIAAGNTVDFCGSGGCSVWVFQNQGGTHYHLLLTSFGHEYYIRRTRTQSYPDFVAIGQVGAYHPSMEVFKWQGSAYKKNCTMFDLNDERKVERSYPCE